MCPLTIISTVILCIFSLIYLYLKRSFNYWKDKGIDFVKPSFPFGNFKDALFQRIQIGEYLAKIYNSSKADMVGFYIFGSPQLVIRSPDLLRQILVSDFNHFPDRTSASDEKADPVCANTLLIMKNPEWKTTRQKVTPVFTISKVKMMLKLIDRCSKDLLDHLDKNRHIVPIDAKEIILKFTTDAITSCAFGVDANCFKDEDAPFRVAGRKMNAATIGNGFRFNTYFLMPKLVSWFRIPFFDPAAISFLKDAFLKTIALREDTGAKRHDLIDILIEMKKNNVFSEGNAYLQGDRAVAQGVQFFGAGFETTSSAISFALYEFCFFPEVQEKARRNVLQVYKKFGEWNYEALQELDYVDMVILETVRKYPSLPFLDRRCMIDYKVPDTDIVIEKGTSVFVPIIGLHYDENHYPDPHKFDPDRFTPEECAKRHQYAYTPFGHGPRNCIGEPFGRNAAKLGLAQILLHYKVEACKETPRKINYIPQFFALIPSEGLPMKFIKCTDQL